MAEDYIYAVTRIHIREKYMLNRLEMDSLASAKSLQEALGLLAAKGWETSLVSGRDVEPLINREYEKTWALAAEAAGEIKELDMLRKTRDFHNLKAAIKLVYTGGLEQNQTQYFMEYGLIPLSRIVKAAETRDFAQLPGYMPDAGEKAWKALVDTGNGQLCEAIVDCAALEQLDAEGKASKSPLLRQYALFTVDMGNIQAAVRCCLLKHKRDFMEYVIARGGSLDKEGLICAALGSEAEIDKFLRDTPYAGAAALSPGAFARWRSDGIIRMIRPQRRAISGVEPLVAYILARENEISMARLILGSKAAGVSGSSVKERLGLTYA